MTSKVENWLGERLKAVLFPGAWTGWRNPYIFYDLRTAPTASKCGATHVSDQKKEIAELRHCQNDGPHRIPVSVSKLDRSDRRAS
jgi:hypothetical protein